MRTECKHVSCDYPGCDQYVLLEKTDTDLQYETLPDNWGTAAMGHELKDLCPDHYQYYQDKVAEFWQQDVSW